MGSSGNACESWRCSSCRGLKAAGAFYALSNGAVQSWDEHGNDAVRFVTLTDHACRLSKLGDLREAWTTFWDRLSRRRSGSRLATSWASVLEYQRRGAVHLHVLMRTPLPKAAEVLEAENLSRIAVASGFGSNVDVGTLSPDGDRISSSFFPDLFVPEEASMVAKYMVQELGNSIRRDPSRCYDRPVAMARSWSQGGLGAGYAAAKAARVVEPDWTGYVTDPRHRRGRAAG